MAHADFDAKKVADACDRIMEEIAALPAPPVRDTGGMNLQTNDAGSEARSRLPALVELRNFANAAFGPVGGAPRITLSLEEFGRIVGGWRFDT